MTVATQIFLRAGGIVGDVWLYNVGPAPIAAPWSEVGARDKMPFKNPAEFCAAEDFDTNLSDDDFSVIFENAKSPSRAQVFVRQKLHAVVGVGLKPGSCRLARGAGPLARPLTGSLEG